MPWPALQIFWADHRGICHGRDVCDRIRNKRHHHYVADMGQNDMGQNDMEQNYVAEIQKFQSWKPIPNLELLSDRSNFKTQFNRRSN